MNNKTLGRLIHLFSKFPGLGERTAKRIVLHLIQNKELLLGQLIHALTNASNLLKECSICKNIDELDKCSICSDPKRDHKVICVVESIIDLWTIEEANFYKGLYHILNSTFTSPHAKNTHPVNINSLIERIEKQDIKEIIIATNATLDGQTTAFSITERLRSYSSIRITRFAHGIPIGGELKYLDEVTLSTAFNSRQNF
ncbi:MAG: recombination protein RecR [Rickettsiales bacterium]|nr:recombination protein RecR [Rickettsiales bacterium]